MLSSLKALSVAVDGLSDRGIATVTETPFALTVASLCAIDVTQLFPLLRAIGWPFQIVDGAGELAESDAFSADYEPFILTLEKPNEGAMLQVISLAGFEALLFQERTETVWEVATLALPFATMSAIFLPWGSAGIFSPSFSTKSPRRLVKEHNTPPKAPSDIRVWLTREPANEQLWSDAVFNRFADLSACALMRSLAGEIKNDGALVFKGPPHTQLDAPLNGTTKALKLVGYNDLREAAIWVYENEFESEQRHGLFTAEFGRTHPVEATAALAFAQIASNVLEGARLAYQLSLSDLTREAIKAQSDLRKAVADDTAKLADNSRQIVTAVAAALATSIGLVAAKVATSTPHWVLQMMAVIVALYVISIITTGWIFMSVQQDMRTKWRSRLYRFIPDADYKAMVLDPCQRAEAMFAAAAIFGGAVAALAVMMVFLAL